MSEPETPARQRHATARQEHLWDLARRIRELLESDALPLAVLKVLEESLALVEAQTK